MKRALLLSLVAGLSLILSPHADAGLIIDVQDATIDPGGLGTIDVFIRSEGTELLDAVNYQFLISPVGAPVSSLVYQDPQDTSEEFEAGNPFDPSDQPYVFFGDNLGLLPFVSSPTDMEDSDLTQSGSGVSLDSTNLLLARLDLEHILGPGQSAFDAGGEQFTISLFVNPIPLANKSFFLDPLRGEIPIEENLSGIVTVNQVAPIPEPTMLTFVAVGAIGLTCRPRRRRRK